MTGLALAACFSGSKVDSTSDAGAERADARVFDASIRADADPSCSARHAVQLWPLAITLLETEPAIVGRAVRVRLHFEHCPGDLLGAPYAAPTLENEFMMVNSKVWRVGGGCEEGIPATRDLVVHFPYAGNWQVVADEPLLLEIFSEPAGECAPSASGACEKDCDCAGGLCLSGSGAAGTLKRCAQPCEFDRECGGAICGDAGGLSGICVGGIDECQLPDRPCADGFACEEGTCRPSFTLSSSTRHTCACDSDCDPGLRCIEGADGPGRCEVICQTNESGSWCEGPHICQGSVDAEPGLCGWIGD